MKLLGKSVLCRQSLGFDKDLVSIKSSSFLWFMLAYLPRRL